MGIIAYGERHGADRPVTAPPRFGQGVAGLCLVAACLLAAPMSTRAAQDHPAVSPSANQTAAPEAPVKLSPKDQHQADDEAKQGADAAAEIAKSTKLVKDKDVIDRVDRIGQRLAAIANKETMPALYGSDKVYPFTWHFQVIDDNQVNAFSLPGGYVYVYNGLLKQVRSDDELAGILGHEITHAAHHHAMAIAHEQSKMSGQFALGLIAMLVAHLPTRDIANIADTAQYAQLGELNIRYSQQAERDADHGGAILMERAGFDPLGMLTFMLHLRDLDQRGPRIELGIFRDHPLTEERVANIRKQLAEMGVPEDSTHWARVTGAARASVVTIPGGAVRIVIGPPGEDQVRLVTLATSEAPNANGIADQLNTLLDNGLQMFEVRADGPDLVAASEVLFTATPADAALVPGATPSSVAADSAKALRRLLYIFSLNGNMPS